MTLPLYKRDRGVPEKAGDAADEKRLRTLKDRIPITGLMVEAREMENELHPPPQGCFRKPFLDSRTFDLDFDLDLDLERNLAKKIANFSAIFDENFEH